jgi:hypothetical protein
MKKVVSAAAKPLRALGRILLKLLGRLRVLRTPLVKLSKLRGRQLVFALVPIVIVLILLFNALKPEPDREGEVRATLDRFEVASRDKDYQTLCDDLLSSKFVERIRNAGLPCEVALRTGLEDRRNPTMTVLSVEMNGDEASAQVRGTAANETPGTSTYQLVREDGAWRIASPGESSGGLPNAGP